VQVLGAACLEEKVSTACRGNFIRSCMETP
jgi:hypothetical protein